MRVVSRIGLSRLVFLLLFELFPSVGGHIKSLAFIQLYSPHPLLFCHLISCRLFCPCFLPGISCPSYIFSPLLSRATSTTRFFCLLPILTRDHSVICKRHTLCRFMFNLTCQPVHLHSEQEGGQSWFFTHSHLVLHLYILFQMKSTSPHIFFFCLFTTPDSIMQYHRPLNTLSLAYQCFYHSISWLGDLMSEHRDSGTSFCSVWIQNSVGCPWAILAAPRWNCGLHIEFRRQLNDFAPGFEPVKTLSWE